MVISAQNTKQKPGYKQTEVGEIPEDWKIEKLGDCLLGAPQYGINAPAVQYTDSLPIYIRITDITDDSRFSPENIASVRYVDGDKYVLKAGDLVFARTGASVGKTYLYKPEDGKLVFAGYLIRVKANPAKLLPGYLAAYVKTEHYWNWVRAMSMRSGQPGINGTEYEQLPIPLPSSTEQHAIATALSDVDALITSLNRLIAKQLDIKQATMQQLLTGKTRLLGFSKELKPGYKQTEVGMIPKEWDVCSLGDVVTKVGSGITPTGGEKVYKKEGRPFLRSQNVGWGHLLLDDIVFISEETHSSFLATEIKLDDVLLNITGASIGRSAVADNRLLGGNVNQHVCIIRADASKFNPHYLNFFLLSEIGQKQIESFQAGGNRQGLNFGQIKSFQIPLPSLPEQQAIADILSDMDAEIVALEHKRDKTRALKRGMMQELLTGKTRLL